MTDGLDLAMRDAGVALLQADASLTIITGPIPPGQQPPYVRVYSSVEWPDGDLNNALDGLATRAVVRWWCHCVGANDRAALLVAERVRTQLRDQRPVIAGMVPGLIRHEQDVPPTVDETTGLAVVDAVHVYRLTVDT